VARGKINNLGVAVEDGDGGADFAALAEVAVEGGEEGRGSYGVRDYEL
jgi:hypothetical protein